MPDDSATEDGRRELRRLASEARHEALRLLREQFPMAYAELHRAALEARGLGAHNRVRPDEGTAPPLAGKGGK